MYGTDIVPVWPPMDIDIEPRFLFLDITIVHLEKNENIHELGGLLLNI